MIIHYSPADCGWLSTLLHKNLTNSSSSYSDVTVKLLTNETLQNITSAATKGQAKSPSDEYFQ